MSDNELDDLFRSNADYLADQPPRDFDKDAFWQQMQTAIPPKANQRKKTPVWGWAAAAVLLLGLLGGVWWIQSGHGLEKQKLAQGVESIPATKNGGTLAKVPLEITQPQAMETQTAKANAGSQPIAVSPQPSGTHVGKGTTWMYEKTDQQVPPRTPLPETEPVTVAIQEYSPPQPAVEVTKPLPEIPTENVPEQPTYRVVHINEIRAQKQQEAKARTRLAFRIGLPPGTRLTTQSDHQAPLSIPIQN